MLVSRGKKVLSGFQILVSAHAACISPSSSWTQMPHLDLCSLWFLLVYFVCFVEALLTFT